MMINVQKVQYLILLLLKLNNSAPRLGVSEKWRFESVDGATVVPNDLWRKTCCQLLIQVQGDLFWNYLAGSNFDRLQHTSTLPHPSIIWQTKPKNTKETPPSGRPGSSGVSPGRHNLQNQLVFSASFNKKKGPRTNVLTWCSYFVMWIIVNLEISTKSSICSPVAFANQTPCVFHMARGLATPVFLAGPGLVPQLRSYSIFQRPF